MTATRIPTDNEANVGNGVVVGRRGVFVYATPEVDPRGDFLGREG